ncbi:unnamed protein product [Hapterophycus canaliculatus]
MRDVKRASVDMFLWVCETNKMWFLCVRTLPQKMNVTVELVQELTVLLHRRKIVRAHVPESEGCEGQRRNGTLPVRMETCCVCGEPATCFGWAVGRGTARSRGQTTSVY